MMAGRAFHTAVSLNDGRILISGGYNGTYLKSAEIYDPATGKFTAASPMTTARAKHTATVMGDGSVLIAGGLNNAGSLNSAEVYDPVLGSFSPVTGSMIAARSSHTATLVQTPTTDTSDTSETVTSSKVLIAGGTNGSTVLDTAEIYDSAARQFTQTTGSMSSARQGQTATLLTGVNQGYIRVQSPIGAQFSEIYNNGGAEASMNGIDVDRFVGIKKIYSPQFAIMPDYITLVNIINANQDSAATVTLTLHAPDGTVLSSPVTKLLSQNAQIKGNLLDLFHNDPSLLNKTGWLEVTSSVDRIVGTVSFTNSNDAFLASFELSGTPMKNFLFPLVSEDFTDYGTGIALLNSGDAVANVQLELWGPSGTLDSSATVVLAPHAQQARSLSGFFPGMQGHRYGNVRVRSNQPLHSFAILYSSELHFISAVPAVPYPGQ
jgi:hypothetical protein